MKQRRQGPSPLALVIALVVMLVPLSPAMAGGGSGHAGGGAVGHGAFWQGWAYRDDDSGGFGGYTVASIDKAFGVMRIRDGANGTTAQVKREALEEANRNCMGRFDQAHPDRIGQGNCRVTGVGVVVGMSGGQRVFDGVSMAQHSIWMDNWRLSVAVRPYSNRGVSYRTSQTFWDQPGDSLDGLAERYAGNEHSISLVVLMLNDFEPRPADQPPSQADKQVEPGTSADQMTNQTRITTNTGANGRELVFRDDFQPMGQRYTVGNQRVVDLTDGQDLSGHFEFNTGDGATPPANRAVAVWRGGDMPTNHVWQWGLDVTVYQPTISVVQDTGAVWWKGVTLEVEHPTPTRSFPTWAPNPDKSWVLRNPSTGQWRTVIDPERTNRTGADGHVFLDGDEVGAVVNATVDSGLIQAPDLLSLDDDWSAADYLVDQEGAEKVRVYEAKGVADGDGRYRHSSVSDISEHGVDVTDRFDITVSGTTVRARAKSGYLARLQRMPAPLQVTMLVPFVVNFANGGGAAQVRQDMGKGSGEEVNFCAAMPAQPGGDGSLTNRGFQTVNGQTAETNRPGICGYLPPVRKDVVSESSQGGTQGSVDGKIVHPGQRLEYQLDSQPSLPASLAYPVKEITFTDTYDQWFRPDKQTLELMDLTRGRPIPKSGYSTHWDDARHLVRVSLKDAGLIGQWRASGNPRVQLRFEGTVDKAAPTDHRVDNQWVLTINNSMTPSNRVVNPPPEVNPVKHVVSSRDQTVSIDGRTLLQGDTGVYRITMDVSQSDLAYKVWRLGLVDDFDDEHLSIDPGHIRVMGSDGQDYTARFNIQIQGGVVYAFARTVDTFIPATGLTVNGDPQPADLAAYARRIGHSPLGEPSIDQSLLGRTYDLILPYRVIRVGHGQVLRNQGVQVLNDIRRKTNVVSNPLQPLNPTKDVVVEVGGRGSDGRSVYRDGFFLYRLDSSILPPGRAYPQADQWRIEDQLVPAVDRFTGQWAVYASRDLYRGGKVLVHKGGQLAGSDFDASPLGGDLFTLVSGSDGKVAITATATYLAMVSAMPDQEVGWRAYLQCRRLVTVDRHENRFTEYYQDKMIPSNVVWTRTPELTPGLHVEKFDKVSGYPDGDRDHPGQALPVAGDTDIVFRITNDSGKDPGTGGGALFRAKDLTLEDWTVNGGGRVIDFRYPQGWNDLILKPGQSVDVRGTLVGVSGHHTDRARVKGSPLTTCPVDSPDFMPDQDGSLTRTAAAGGFEPVEGQTLCADTEVESNLDDWNGISSGLSATGAQVSLALVLLTISSFVGLVLLLLVRKRRK
nr:LPXTG cell wall anchor domain-containing protein [Bifidobacterium indicum]